MGHKMRESLATAKSDIARYNDVHPCGGSKLTCELEELLLAVMKELAKPGSGVTQDFENYDI